MSTLIRTEQGTPDRFSHERNDCVVRALANCLGIAYKTAHKLMASHAGRADRDGTKWTASHTLFASLGFTCTYYGSNRQALKQAQQNSDGAVEKGITLATFLKSNKGACMVGINGHMFAVIDNRVIDNGNTLPAGTRINKVYR